MIEPGHAYPDFSSLAAAWLDDDAIKTSIATVAAATTYSGAQLNGVTGEGALPGRSAGISITASSSVGSYSTAAILVTGLNWRSEIITESIALTTANGNEVIQTTLGFYKCTSVAFPPMVNTSGAFKIGVKDLLFQPAARGFHAGKATSGDYKIVSPRGQSATITLVPGFYPLAVSKVDSTQADYPFIAFR